MKLKVLALVAVGGVLSAAAAGAQIMRSGYKGPTYTVQREDGDIEVRAYGPRIVAETTVNGADFRAGTSRGFSRLAGFIFGKNKTSSGESTKIAMTTPVESAPTSDGSYTIVFTMPSGYTVDDLPRPDDPDVVIRELPAATVATIRFSGVARKQDIAALSEELLSWLDREGYVTDSPVKVAQYDPPWVIGPLRRNELMVDVVQRRVTGEP